MKPGMMLKMHPAMTIHPLLVPPNAPEVNSENLAIYPVDTDHEKERDGGTGRIVQDKYN